MEGGGGAIGLHSRIRRTCRCHRHGWDSCRRRAASRAAWAAARWGPSSSAQQPSTGSRVAVTQSVKRSDRARAEERSPHWSAACQRTSSWRRWMVLARWCAALAARGSRFRLGSGEEVYAAAGLGEDGVRRRQHGRGKRETRGDTQAAHGERAREGEEGPGAVVCHGRRRPLCGTARFCRPRANVRRNASLRASATQLAPATASSCE